MAKNDAIEKAAPAAAPQTFKLDQLRKHALKVFGVTAETFAGATAELPVDGDFTVDEVKDTIERWGKKEAK